MLVLVQRLKIPKLFPIVYNNECYIVTLSIGSVSLLKITSILLSLGTGVIQQFAFTTIRNSQLFSNPLTAIALKSSLHLQGQTSRSPDNSSGYGMTNGPIKVLRMSIEYSNVCQA